MLGPAADTAASDAQGIADQYGMTVAEATTMLAQQESFDRLQKELAVAYPSFNDGWSTGRGSTRRLVVSFHKNVPADIDDRAASHGLAVVAKSSQHSKAELAAITTRLADELAENGYDAILGFDLESEKVSALVRTGFTARELRTKLVSSRDAAIELSTTTEAISMETSTYAYGAPSCATTARCTAPAASQ